MHRHTFNHRRHRRRFTLLRFSSLHLQLAFTTILDTDKNAELIHVRDVIRAPASRSDRCTWVRQANDLEENNSYFVLEKFFNKLRD